MGTQNNKTENKKINVHSGHRQRMREKFFQQGIDGFDDHEVLEMLLYYVLPQRNTNSIAHDLINHFGSFSAVLEADTESLVSRPYVSENAAFLIKFMLPVYNRYIKSVTEQKKKFDTTDDIVAYLRSKYVGNTHESVYALFFDAEGNLIVSKKINDGDISSSFFDLRKLASAALETKATSVIISHNHPHGVALPSREDVAITQKAFDLLKSLKVKLSDHIILTETAHFSMVSTIQFANIFYDLPSP
ncbi:MAG: JAB domain-containing protein [Acutalibacteraceae bacterium]|nr:JAB domain-containing protein [Acutalibacteraceae bacterium]